MSSFQPGVLLRGGQLPVGVPIKYVFLFFNPFFKPLKISFNFMFNPAYM